MLGKVEIYEPFISRSLIVSSNILWAVVACAVELVWSTEMVEGNKEMRDEFCARIWPC